MAPPDQKPVAAALDAMAQKKARFAEKIQALFKAKEMNQGIDPSMLTLLKTDINAFIAAVRGFVDVSCKKTAPADP